MSLSDSGCVTVLGGNCAEPLAGTFSGGSPSGALAYSYTAPVATATAQYNNPESPFSNFFNTASSNIGGSYDASISLAGGTITASVGALATASETGNGTPGSGVDVDAVAGGSFSTSINVTTPTYYSVNFAPGGGAQIAQFSSASWFYEFTLGSSCTMSTSSSSPNAQAGSCSGVLQPGTYRVFATAHAQAGVQGGDVGPASGLGLGSTADFSLQLTLSQNPIVTPLPAALWLLLSGLGGLRMMTRKWKAA
jgi:hypothetical protein